MFSFESVFLTYKSAESHNDNKKEYLYFCVTDDRPTTPASPSAPPSAYESLCEDERLACALQMSMTPNRQKSKTFFQLSTNFIMER